MNQYVQTLDLNPKEIGGEDGENLKGRAALKSIGDLLDPTSAERMYPEMDSGNHERKNIDGYEEKYKIYYEPILGPYFRLFFNILRHVDRSEYLTDFEKLEYAKIARSYLSNAEVRIIAFNSLSTNGKKMKGTIAKYRMIKYLTRRDGAWFPFIVERYGKDVFEGRFD